MRTLLAFAVSVFIGTSQLTAQVIAPPSSRGTTRAAAARGGTAAPAPPAQAGVYLVTFRPGTPAAERSAVVQGHGARVRSNFNAGNVISVEVPDTAVLARLRNDPRVLGVFTNQKILIEQGRGGGSSKPKPPESLAAVAASSTAINLSWADVSDNESGFAIERCAGSGCANFTEIFRTVANAATYGDTGRTAATVYRYRILAFNTAGNSKYSNIAQATTLSAPLPSAPTSLSATPISNARVELSWSDTSNNETGFRIERCTGAGCTSFSEIFAPGANVVAYSDTGLDALTVYRYRVLAFNAGGSSVYSNIAEATTLAPPAPAAPSGLTATPSSDTQVDLSWSDNSSSEDGFRVERCTGAGCTSFSEIFAAGAQRRGL